MTDIESARIADTARGEGGIMGGDTVRVSIPQATVAEMIELANHALADGMPNAALALIKQTLKAELRYCSPECLEVHGGPCDTDGGGPCMDAPQDNVVAPWTAWLAVVLLECTVCSALIKNDPQARQNHELYHHRRGDE